MAELPPAPELADALRRALRGETDFSVTARALTTMDASNYRRVPLGVVAPRDADDVAAALAVCRRYGVPVVARGGGTSIAGQATGTGVVLDFTRHMNAVVDVDPATRTAVVQPGLVLDTLQAAVRPHGLAFGPDPSTHSRCTLGGMIGNNACGAHSVAWGTTADNVRSLSVITYRGDTHRLERATSDPSAISDPSAAAAPSAAVGPAGVRDLVDGNLAALRTGYPPGLPRRISGYALDALLPERGPDPARAYCGSEGTLAVLTEAVVHLVEPPAARALAVLGYADESAAADAAPALLPLGPLTVEGMADDLVPALSGGSGSLPRGRAWLFVETGGETAAEARSRAEAIVRAGSPLAGAVVGDPVGMRALWRIREDAAGTATRTRDGREAWPGWEDCAVPPARLGAYLRDFRTLLTSYGLRGTPFGHFGEGCVHVRIDFDLTSENGVRRFRAFSEEIAALVVSHGGSLSGEHGDGQARAELLPKMYGDELVGLFGRFKDLWDPDGGLNPGVLVRPAPLDRNLRFAVLPRRPVDVILGYRDDGGDFAGAVRRCVGVAKCRTEQPDPSSVMCPSYRVTREEAHSTRGRARLLHEMLAGELVRDGWRSREVRDALDLCLACKGCRSDCPVGVDMALYKAEFLHHHYAGRLRPRAHYALGRLPFWLRLASPLAAVLNPLGRTRLAALALRAAGLTPQRPLPPLARTPFRRSLRGAGALPAPGAGPRVLLWPDTFTEYLSPQVGHAALRVLGAAGVGVALPPGRVCCGLTYLSTGQLDRARRVLRRTLQVVDPVLRDGTTVTVLEPSCAAALRTDLPELLPDDPRATRLAGAVRTFAQTLAERTPQWTPPRLDRPVAGQTHCHQHAVLGDTAERALRDRAGLTGDLSGGCCGLAGNFGFEKGHFAISSACAEEQLLPSVRSAPPGAVLLADGYSCRTQLEQLGGVRARHLAEVLADALGEGLTVGRAAGQER
ncbi:FAD-binding and (Fe-S)-binding domain-containing protein [Streptomyces yaizuensis]|uniref:FAD-binding oxidoreductase n=1 Tax=Streptomyces yaizuensis TaxID=2989713 RepID=A0ABQ5P3V6_9ACTN|nr:FAD-binding and (Fe-S)-binding domain-containing protein [Streptomyces sp. YSPA8]GLF97239.1 FAD-binding oxidoreductase [Streptomyces sp. YSPA8]